MITRRDWNKMHKCAMCKNLQQYLPEPELLWPDPKNLSRFLEERRTTNGRKCRYSSMSHGTRIASKVLNRKSLDHLISFHTTSVQACNNTRKFWPYTPFLSHHRTTDPFKEISRKWVGTSVIQEFKDCNTIDISMHSNMYISWWVYFVTGLN